MPLLIPDYAIAARQRQSQPQPGAQQTKTKDVFLEDTGQQRTGAGYQPSRTQVIDDAGNVLYEGRYEDAVAFAKRGGYNIAGEREASNREIRIYNRGSPAVSRWLGEYDVYTEGVREWRKGKEEEQSYMDLLNKDVQNTMASGARRYLDFGKIEQQPITSEGKPVEYAPGLVDTRFDYTKEIEKGFRQPEEDADFYYIQQGSKVVDKYLVDDRTYKKYGIFGGEEKPYEPGKLYRQDIFGITKEFDIDELRITTISEQEKSQIRTAELLGNVGVIGLMPFSRIIRTSKGLMMPSLTGEIVSKAPKMPNIKMPSIPTPKIKLPKSPDIKITLPSISVSKPSIKIDTRYIPSKEILPKEYLQYSKALEKGLAPKSERGVMGIRFGSPGYKGTGTPKPEYDVFKGYGKTDIARTSFGSKGYSTKPKAEPGIFQEYRQKGLLRKSLLTDERAVSYLPTYERVKPAPIIKRQVLVMERPKPLELKLEVWKEPRLNLMPRLFVSPFAATQLMRQSKIKAFPITRLKTNIVPAINVKSYVGTHTRTAIKPRTALRNLTRTQIEPYPLTETKTSLRTKTSPRTELKTMTEISLITKVPTKLKIPDLEQMLGKKGKRRRRSKGWYIQNPFITLKSLGGDYSKYLKDYKV